MSTSGEPLTRPAEATAANWQEPPFNRWAFWHVREVLPTQRIAAARSGLPWPEARADRDLLGLEVTLHDHTRSTVAEVLERTYTDAYAVAQDGALVAEWYASTGGPRTPHAALSVTKSVVGCVAGILVERGLLDLRADVASYLPELADSGYAGATVQQLLDMRSGVRFREDYTNPHAEIRRLGAWVTGARRGDAGLYRFLTTLRQEAPHGSRFLYRSAETDALGWVCERVSGARMAELVSDLLWAPMGAEHDAEILCDTHGTAVHDGGLAATARDLLRFGQLLLDGGSARGADGSAAQVVPGQWLRRCWAVDADVRRAFLGSPAEASFPGGWYRNQLWFRPGAHGDVLLCLGIHGQMLHVSRRTGTVCVKLSSWPDAQNPSYLQDTLHAFDAIGGALVHRESASGTHGLPGVVSGLRRSGAASQRRGGSVV